MRAVALTTLSAFVATSCGGRAPGPTHGGGASPVSDAALEQTKDAPPGLDLRLSNGHAGAPAYDRAKLAPATKLGDPDVAAMFARTNAITTDPSDAQPFALRPSSQPVPRTGKTVTGAFPPPPSSLLPPPATGNRGGLTVLRYMPEGKVPLAPQLSVTFSEPMIAVTSQADAAATVPVHITPTPPGHWRWIGTRTIVFDPDVRFPQATTYQVDIPAGIKSASGDALKAATHFTFETPAPTVAASYPSSGPQRLDVPMFLQFDQKIDPAAVLAKLRVTIGGAPRSIRLLDAAEIARDKQLAAAVKAATDSEQGGRWLAFRTTDPLPTGSTIDVAIPAGTPSAEGPNTTTADQHVSFTTYAPLTLTESSCGYNHTCRPNQPWSIEFNNPLDEDAFTDAQLVIDPPLPGAKVTFQGQTIVVLGATHPRTKYRATVASSLRDQFGQSLGAPKTVTFDVGDAEPTFYGPSDFVIVDPAARVPALDFFSINYTALKVKLYKVTPADLEAFSHYEQEQWNKDHPPKLPGTKVFDGLVKTAPNAGTLVETHVDLHDALDKSGFGEALAIVEPSPWTETYPAPRLISWVQATKLAVDLHVDGDHLNAFVTDLATGAPVAGATVEMHPFAATATTDAKGMATIALPAKNAVGLRYVTARKGGDQVMVVGNSGDGGWVKQTPAPEIAWYVTDDRQLYKPGEQVSLKGWLRRIELTKGGDVGPLGAGVTAVDYTVTDSRGNQIGKGTAPINALGGFDTTFTLPKTPNLGSAYVAFKTVGTQSSGYSHVFQIQEFRRPEFSVTAAASQGPFVVGGSGDITVDAKYYAGGPLPGAEVSWNVTAVQSQFTPPNRDDYTFGAWTPWWSEGGRGFDDDYGGGGGRFGTSHSWSLTGKTDGGGSHTLHLDFLSAKPAMPMSVVASANVVDVNRQAQSSTATLLVHPADLYVGVKAAKPFVEQGQPFAVDVIGVDLDGKAAPGAKIEVRAVRLDWEYKHGRYATVERDPQTCSIVAAAAPVPCSIATAKGGSYELTATILDRKGRANQTKLPFWVAGGDQPPAREVRQEQVQLIPDKKEYAPGDTAQILVQSPFYPAEAIVSWRRQGIIHDERLSLSAATTIKVPITDAMTPNLYVQVDVAGAAVRSDDHGDPDPALPKRPAYAVGVLDLAIPAKQRTLAVTVTPSAAKLAPGESDTLAVVVRDAAGRPVANAEAAVIVVDESILALTGFQFVNPIDVFYNQRPAGAEDSYARGYVKLAAPDLDVIAAATTANEVSRAYAAPGAPPPPPSPSMSPAPEPMPEKRRVVLERFAAKDEDQNNLAPGPTTAIAVRTNFNPLAAFSPTVHTGADGTARVPIKVPDNLTRYRVVAIAVAGGQQFGKGESAITARLPLMVRPSPPRFLNFGDTFKLPVVVQNQTDRELKVRVAVRASNAAITDGGGREVTVPPNDRVEVQFPAAAELAGTAHFQIVGTAGSYADAAELALPVWTPATTEAFATYGVIDSGATKQPVALPGQVVKQFGGIEVTTASTNLQALTDALLYLVHYPFECAEQRSSRIAAIAALRDVLTAFKTKDMPSAAAMNASVATDIEHLTQMQNGDGSFGFWERGGDGWPYLTVFVTNALVRAKQKGFAVPADMLARAMGYVKTVEQHYPPYYSREVRAAISAFALYTRKLAGDVDVAKAGKVISDAGGLDKLGMETAGWLLGTLAGNPAAADQRKALVRLAMNHVSETAGAANFTTDYGDGNYLLLGSARRVDGVMLESLIEEQPTLDLIPKIVTGLLAHRKAGRWGNTQEDSFILVALDKYFQTYEKATPDFVARVWLGADYAGDHTFKGHTTEYFTVPIPMIAVAAHDHQDVTIQKDGAGRLYYRIGMTYAPASLKLDAADYGFVVERRYEAIDDPHDVSRAADGSWHIKAGARVRIRLTMVNDNRRYHVALVDPLPAGLETMNPELATTGPIPQDPKEQTSRGAYWWWYATWYEHQNTRDERTEAFASLLWEGVHNYSYVARATTPGSFVVPPPKAEEMYMPETFGRGASDRVIVE